MSTSKQWERLAEEAIADAGEWKARARKAEALNVENVRDPRCGKCAAFGTNSKGPGAHIPGCISEPEPSGNVRCPYCSARRGTLGATPERLAMDAASEMLEALRAMWKQHHCWTKEEKRDAEGCAVCDAARTAIAKATGGDK